LTTGILALQGAIDAHKRHLTKIGEPCISVRSELELNSVDRLIIPGGESTTMLKLIKKENLFDSLKAFAETKPVWGVCAGAILLAKQVINPEQESLGVANIKATRNFYGSQLQSFSATVKIEKIAKEITCDFIRAPYLEPMNSTVEVLAWHEKQAVLLQQENILLCSFHAELNEESNLHQYFLHI